MNGTLVASEVVTAGTALAGLILIYIGSLVTSYNSYAQTEKKSVKSQFLFRAITAVIGLVLALIAATLAIIGKWVASCCIGNVAVWFLLAAFGWAVFTTFQTIREIK